MAPSRSNWKICSAYTLFNCICLRFVYAFVIIAIWFQWLRFQICLDGEITDLRMLNGRHPQIEHYISGCMTTFQVENSSDFPLFAFQWMNCSRKIIFVQFSAFVLPSGNSLRSFSLDFCFNSCLNWWGVCKGKGVQPAASNEHEWTS